LVATGVAVIAAALTEEDGSIGDGAIGDAAIGDAMIEAEWIEAEEEEDEGADAAKGGGNDPGTVLCVLDRVADPDPYWIRIQSGQWIRIRIRIRNPDKEG
jgi:hypothetical protein